MMALELDPARRYATARALREDLERYVDGREAPIAVRSERTRAMARTSRYFFRRHRWRVAVAAMALIALSVWWKTQHDVKRSAAAAPVLAAFKVPISGAHVESIRDDQPVLPGDILGVTVSTAQSQYVYALSVFRLANGPRYFNPVKMHPLARLHDKDLKDPDEWYREAPTGENDFVCSRVESNAAEGLLVIATPERRTDIEDWLERLKSRSKENSPPGVVEDAAWLALKDPPVSRGEPIGGLTQEQRARYYAAFRGAWDTPGSEIEFPGGRVFKLECPVSK
jgi:hypothetical protein